MLPPDAAEPYLSAIWEDHRGPQITVGLCTRLGAIWRTSAAPPALGHWLPAAARRSPSGDALSRSAGPAPPRSLRLTGAAGGRFPPRSGSPSSRRRRSAASAAR